MDEPSRQHAAPPDGADPRSVEGLEQLRALVGGRSASAGHPRPTTDDVGPPRWVPLDDRVRAAWLRVPASARGALCAVLAGVLAVACWWLLRPPPVPAELTLPTVTASSLPTRATDASSEAPSAPAELLVHVAGAVRRPGVVHVVPGARLIDLLAAAGGATAEADLDRLNLAAPALDGARVYVPRRGEEPPTTVPVQAPPSGAVSGGSEGATGAAPVDLNAADVATLEQLPGVGPVTAAAIVAHRDTHGPFTSVEGLLEVHGIGPAKLETLAPLVVVSG
jgi:competence protein ComEA